MARTLIRLNTNSLGDTIGASPYFEKYRAKTSDEVFVSCNHHDLFASVYPKIDFLPNSQNPGGKFDNYFNLDFRFDVPLQKGFSDQLGLEYEEIRPKVAFSPSLRPFGRRYVCVAMQSTSQCKYWNHDGGWDILFEKLKRRGLTPICVDLYNSFGIDGHFNNTPDSCIDKTGLSISDVMQYLHHCEFFIGLSSGLSWLAYAMQKHVVLISGSTHAWCEPKNDLTRIIDKSVCHGCFNEPATTPFNPSDWLWCPRNAGTSDQFICTKAITPDSVWNEMKEVKLV